MKWHFRVIFTLLALVGVLVITAPLPAQAASQSDAVAQPFVLQGPHVLLQHQLTASAAAGNLLYRGGPVMAGIAHIYAIFWEPGTNPVAANYNALIVRYFRDIGSSPLYKIARQYKNSKGQFPTNAVLSGVYIDGTVYNKSTLLDSDFRAEVKSVQGIERWKSSLNNIFFVFTGRGEKVCTDSSHKSCTTNGLCAYHNHFGSNTIYAVMPYAICSTGSSPNRNPADLTIDVTSHEEMEAATDPLLNAWFDSRGSEIGDKCRPVYGPRNAQGADVVWNKHPYIVQEEWSNVRHGCRLTP